MSGYFMLDTNIASYITSGRSEAARLKLASLDADKTACISSITEAELLYGLAKRPRASTLRPFHALIAKLAVLPWGRAEAAVYGELRAQQEAAGKLLGNLDMLIAAHALAAGATLVSNDQAFRHIAHLRVENWATDL